MSAEHAVPFDFFTSEGQVVDAPVQVSCRSHSPAVGRQTEPALPAGCWQVSAVPLQESAEQTFPSSVHAVPFDFFASTGQLAELPGQVSATSHSPATGRHEVPLARKLSAGHAAEDPVQFSTTSHAPALERQTVLAPRKESVGQVVELPVQFSAWSHAAATGRHTVLDDAAL